MKRFVTFLMLMPFAVFPLLGVQQKPAEPQHGAGASGMMMQCPMNLQGTDVVATDTPTGIAVTITTKQPADVAELRRRVEQMATMHSGAPSTEAMAHGQMMPATVKYEPIENGARLILTPKDSAQLAKFRTDVRAHAERMKTGECSMMQEMMQGMMKGMMGGMGKALAEPKAEPKKDETDHSAHHPGEKP